jgi:hypothetical protein
VTGRPDHPDRSNRAPGGGHTPCTCHGDGGKRRSRHSTAYTATRRRVTGSRAGTRTCTAPRPCARSPSLACPIHQFAPGGGGGASLERRACIALHASCMALSPRARELPARTAAGGALGPGHASQQRGRPRAEQRARLALASFDAYAWHGRRAAGGSSCFACSSGRAASGRAASVCLDRRLFISRQRNPKEFLRPCLFVRMNELA